MKLRTFLAATALIGLVSLAAGAASAQIIYDNGAPNATGGNEAVAWVQAEDFTFNANTAVGGAGVYIAGSGGLANWDGGFQYYIFSDNLGTPGTVLQSGSVTPTVTDSGIPWCCVGDAYLFAFDFSSTFAAAANTTYFLGIHAGDLTNFNRDNIYWVDTNPNATETAEESLGGTLNNWDNNGAEHAFYLTGATSPAPEPAAWALMIGGFGLAGVALRRRRTAIA